MTARAFSLHAAERYATALIEAAAGRLIVPLVGLVMAVKIARERKARP